MVQRDTPIDKYLLGDKSALSESQLKGKALFEGKANYVLATMDRWRQTKNSTTLASLQALGGAMMA